MNPSLIGAKPSYHNFALMEFRIYSLITTALISTHLERDRLSFPRKCIPGDFNAQDFHHSRELSSRTRRKLVKRQMRPEFLLFPLFFDFLGRLVERHASVA